MRFSDTLRAFRSYDYKVASLEARISVAGKSMTQQQFKDECDINTIVKRFGITGEIPVSNRTPLPDGIYGHLDYHACLNELKQADKSFMDLPADVRARFKNDPGSMLDFVVDPANRDEAIKLGLISPPPVVAAPAPNPS